MKSVRAFCLLLTSVVLSASSALHAQPREPVPPLPDNLKNMYEHGRLTDQEERGANPCPRTDHAGTLHPVRKGAQISICVGSVKSGAVTGAWAKGLDEYGVQLAPDAGARKLAEMELWLRRLAGKFRVEGEYSNSGGISQVRGTADCFVVGSGPGVSCTLSAKWQAPKETCKDPRFDKALYSAVQPLVLLFGIDPGASQVRVTLVDFRAVRMQGFLVDGAVIFAANSPGKLLLNPLVTYHWLTSRVALKPGSDVDLQFMLMGSDIRALQCPRVRAPAIIRVEFDLKLQREPAARAQVQPGAP